MHRFGSVLAETMGHTYAHTRAPYRPLAVETVLLLPYHLRETSVSTLSTVRVRNSFRASNDGASIHIA